MSAQAATALFERVGSDEDFRAELEAAPTPQEKHRIVTEAGYEVTPDDLSVIRNLAGVSELSDEDLEKVAGGVGTDTQVGVAVGAFVAIVASAMAIL
jgi:predicted ribosomally synthesized peptide with nif11-like leader